MLAALLVCRYADFSVLLSAFRKLGQATYELKWRLTRKRGNCESLQLYAMPALPASLQRHAKLDVAQPIHCRIIAFLLLIHYFRAAVNLRFVPFSLPVTYAQNLNEIEKYTANLSTI